jgi:hypothetical protein
MERGGEKTGEGERWNGEGREKKGKREKTKGGVRDGKGREEGGGIGQQGDSTKGAGRPRTRVTGQGPHPSLVEQ